MLKTILIAALLFNPLESQAKGLLERVRDFIQSLIPQNEIALPTLPTLNKDATSTQVYEVKENQNENLLKGEEKAKYDQVFLKELYQAVRNTPASDQELGTWLNAMSQGAVREGVYRALVLNDDYANLEGRRNNPSPQSVIFAMWFLDRFAGLTYEESDLKKLGLYTLKRECTEKALEIFDAFMDRDQRADWYAVLSSELAEKYPEAMRSSRRLEKSKAIHKEWSQAAPIQHIKGELIIKIHTIFNTLN